MAQTQVVRFGDGKVIAISRPHSLQRIYCRYLATAWWEASPVFQMKCGVCNALIPFGFGLFLLPEDILICEQCFEKRSFEKVTADWSVLWECLFPGKEKDKPSITVDIKSLFEELGSKLKFSVEESRTRNAYLLTNDISITPHKQIDKSLWRSVQDAVLSGCTSRKRWETLLSIQCIVDSTAWLATDSNSPPDEVVAKYKSLLYTPSANSAGCSLYREGYLRKIAPNIGRDRLRWFRMGMAKIIYYAKGRNQESVISRQKKGEIALTDVNQVEIEPPELRLITENRVFRLVEPKKGEKVVFSWAKDIVSLCLFNCFFGPDKSSHPQVERIITFLRSGAEPNVGIFHKTEVPPLALSVLHGDEWVSASAILISFGAIPSCLLRKVFFFPPPPIPGSPLTKWQEMFRSEDSMSERMELVISHLLHAYETDVSIIGKLRGDDDDGFSLVHLSCLLQDTKSLNRLIDDNSLEFSECVDGKGRTPLQLAIKCGYIELSKYFIDKGVNLNVADDTCDTPLLAAMRHGREEIVELLFEKLDQIDVNSVDREGRTCSYVACVWGAGGGMWDYLSLLLETGSVKCGIRDRYGDTLVHFFLHCCWCWNVDVGIQLRFLNEFKKLDDWEYSLRCYGVHLCVWELTTKLELFTARDFLEKEGAVHKEEVDVNGEDLQTYNFPDVNKPRSRGAIISHVGDVGDQ